jgi:hypothetical protein
MQGPGLNGGGDGDDGGPDTRVLTNIAIGVGVIYLSVTGQLGWILDAIVSVGLLAVILPIVGLGAFYLWASRDIVESDCPHCGTEFQVLKSDVKDDMLECPFCSQPFSVVDDEFIPDPEKFYNQPNSFGQAFSRRSKQGNSYKPEFPCYLNQYFLTDDQLLIVVFQSIKIKVGLLICYRSL